MHGGITFVGLGEVRGYNLGNSVELKWLVRDDPANHFSEFKCS